MSFRAEPTGEPAREDPWRGVAAAGDTVAAWSAKRVMVSENGGRSFDERLRGEAGVDGVAVVADGTVYVVRDRQLGVRRAGRERWRRVSFAGFPSLLAAGAGKLVWLGHQNARPIDSENTSRPLVAVSGDDGASWTFQRPNEYQELYLLRASVSEDGRISIDVTFGDCRSWDAVMRGRVDGRRWNEKDREGEPASVRDGKGREWRISDAGAIERRDRGSQWVTVRSPGETDG